MKNLFFILAFFFSCCSAQAQDITGIWSGILKVPTGPLTVVFHILKSGDGLDATMDSPDQGVTGIPVSAITFESPKLHIEAGNGKIIYDGILQEDHAIQGTFKQSGQSFSLDLSRGHTTIKEALRPQEPQKPYPYRSEDITFENNKAGIQLSGTLTLPEQEGTFPAAVLISGSGPQNRDEEILRHKPFLVLSDYLTRQGIAVLRFDDRGTAKSGGDFKTATTADFATDVEAAVAYLKAQKEINTKEIGLIGHSEGGIIAPMVAAKNKAIAFIVLLAGPGVNGAQVLLMQEEAIGKASGMSSEAIGKWTHDNRAFFNIIVHSKNEPEMKKNLAKYMESTLPDTFNEEKKKELTEITIQKLTTPWPWMLYFLKTDPAVYLEKVRCPVLALGGTHDLQVPAEANIAAIKKALKSGGNNEVTTKIFPGLNHLFQQSATGLPGEYAHIEQTFAPEALKEIGDWIVKQISQ